ncbi:hypothetical protein SAMN04489841_4249 [Natrinema salaciae]|uniref:Uncharacterized protein n=2 Tax=Natrinema salaciae TaxID=1186196 RepID=A0A1H9R3S6_9EURY|nr:hypothetical protein SAMN04489841_4249 [Natrinema salaciae]
MALTIEDAATSAPEATVAGAVLELVSPRVSFRDAVLQEETFIPEFCDFPVGMAHKDDVSRVLAACTACGSVYAARQWPDDTIRVIGQDGCSCGSTDFELVDDTADDTEVDFEGG